MTLKRRAVELEPVAVKMKRLVEGRMSQPDITFVTCSSLPDLDPDDRLLFAHLQSRGWRCAIGVWNAASVDWQHAGIMLLRSTWDYHLQPRKFLAWAELCAARLVNPYSLVRWNAHKGYLLELMQHGVPTIPTAILPRQASHLSKSLYACVWKEVVIKPAIGLATHGVKRFSLSDEIERQRACEHAIALAGDTDVLMQPFLESVGDYGERALVFFGGEYSHTVRKTPFQALAVAGQAGETSVTATDDEIAVAKKALSALSGTPVYARVDLVRNSEGQSLVMELELIEPSLFLSFDPASVERFAAVIRKAP